MTQTVGLTSSDGQFGVSVPADDVELIASMLVLLEVAREATVLSLSDADASRDERPVLIHLAS
jgi:hypothetical protein